MGQSCARGESKTEPVWFPGFEAALPSMSGQRIAITGTTSGTGKVAAISCLKKGAEVFLLNRASQRADGALAEIQQAVPSGSVQQIPCDLQDFASVREAAFQLDVACQGRLDVLCNNAGIMLVPDAPTKDGYCQQMQTNHLSHFLLTCLMLPALRAAAQQNGGARIVNHSSLARLGPKLDTKYYMQKGGNIGGRDRYHQSKLANVLFTYALADRLATENIKAVACTPGIASTNLLQHNPTLQRAANCLGACGAGAQSAEDGTMPLLTGIASLNVESGDLITPSQGQPAAEAKGPPKITKRPCGKVECDDEESRNTMWAWSEKAVQQQFQI